MKIFCSIFLLTIRRYNSLNIDSENLKVMENDIIRDEWDFNTHDGISPSSTPCIYEEYTKNFRTFEITNDKKVSVSVSVYTSSNTLEANVQPNLFTVSEINSATINLQYTCKKNGWGIINLKFDYLKHTKQAKIIKICESFSFVAWTSITSIIFAGTLLYIFSSNTFKTPKTVQNIENHKNKDNKNFIYLIILTSIIISILYFFLDFFLLLISIVLLVAGLLSMIYVIEKITNQINMFNT